MQIGVLSDVHSNDVALRAVLEDMPPVDRLVCAGDVVGYNTAPQACVDAIRDREVPTVMGNHDRFVAEGLTAVGNRMAQAGTAYSIENLDADSIDWLAALPERRRLFEDRVHLVHGHPEDPDRYTYPNEFSPSLLDDADVLIMGHTHVQAVAEFDDGVVLNPGSVGQPRDGDPRAAYATVDLETLTADTHRVEYDVEAVQNAVRAAGLPTKTADRLAEGW